jgi:UDP-GlcNAc:undecaprenyl-phosphate GlcNAc-1-phosphate transferase
VSARLAEIAQEVESLRAMLGGSGGGAAAPSRLEIFHGYIGVLVVAFLVTLLATPLMRRLALSHGVIDRPLESRKAHRTPIAYLGGVAVYLGLLAAVLFSYTNPLHGLIELHPSRKLDERFIPGGVPISVLLGMTVIMLVGLLDDVLHISPRVKVAGQLFAAAALAIDDVGVRVAAGVLVPAAKVLGVPTTTVGGVETLQVLISMGGGIPIDIVYWTGTAIIAVFVLGACNAANLIDGLDGLLAGTTAIASLGLLVIALTLAVQDDGPRDAARIVLCLALLGACLGFLPHNFNPATIFLGDCGSLLLGFTTIVIVLSLGDTGWTQLVVAGLIIYAVPIIDTTLAIVRRRITGRRISDPDDMHIHHILKRLLGVRKAVLALYAMSAAFAALGIALSEGRGRVTYALALVFAAFIGVIALKAARREALEQQVRRLEGAPPEPRPVAKPASPAGASVANGAGVRAPEATGVAPAPQAPPAAP